MMNDNK